MRKEKLVNLQNVAPGATAILNCPIGPTFEKIKINLTGGLTTAMLGQIVGKINQKPFFTVNAADLVAENLYQGRANGNSQIVLDFTRQWARTSSTKAGATSATAEILLTALCSANFQTLTFEIPILGTAPVGVGMSAFGQLSDPSKNPMVMKQQYASQILSNVGDNDLPLAVGSAGSIITQLFMHQTNAGAAGAGSISYLQVRNQGVVILEGAPADLQGDQQDYGRVTQPNLNVLDFDLQGFREKWLNTALSSNVFVRVTTTGGPVALTMYQRTVDPASR